MNPTTFPEANCSFGAPPDLDESQVASIPAFRGKQLGGNLGGSDIIVVAWQPSEEEAKEIASGKPIFLSVVGGLPPHFLATSFPYKLPKT